MVRVSPDELVADPNPDFERILASEADQLELEVRGNPELFRLVEQAGHPASIDAPTDSGR